MFSKVLTTVVVACAVVMNVSFAENRDVKDNCPNIDVSNYEKQCVKTEETLTLNDKELQIGKEYSFKKDAEEGVIYTYKFQDLLPTLHFEYRKSNNNLCNKSKYKYFENYFFYIKEKELYLLFTTGYDPLPIYGSYLFFSNMDKTLKINLKTNEEKIVNFEYLFSFKISKNKNDIKISLLPTNKEYKKVEIINIKGEVEFSESSL